MAITIDTPRWTLRHVINEGLGVPSNLRYGLFSLHYDQKVLRKLYPCQFSVPFWGELPVVADLHHVYQIVDSAPEMDYQIVDLKYGAIVQQPRSRDRVGNWSQTYSGRFWPLDPTVEDVDIEDIAHHLSQICRFNGASKTIDGHIYTVAQHSLYVAQFTEPKFQLEALLHDAAEYVIGDQVRPLKLMMPDFQRYEKEIERVISAKFDLVWPCPSQVKTIDMRMLATERKQLMHISEVDWETNHEPLDVNIKIYSPEWTKSSFLSMFENYKANRSSFEYESHFSGLYRFKERR